MIVCNNEVLCVVSGLDTVVVTYDRLYQYFVYGVNGFCPKNQVFI